MNYREIPVISIGPNPFWKKNAENLVGESVKMIDEGVKQLILVNSLLEGIYAHSIAFADLKPVLRSSGSSMIEGLIYLLPILLWLFSLLFAVLTSHHLMQEEMK